MTRIDEPGKQTLINEGRLVAVETKLDTVIKNQENLSGKMDELLPKLVTHAQLSEKLGYLEKEIELARQSKLKDIVIQILITAPIAALIGYFIRSLTN